VFLLLSFKIYLAVSLLFSFFANLMNLKKPIALFCLIVLCTTVIPLRQIGAILFNNQITEEIAHAIDTGKRLSEEKELHAAYPLLGIQVKLLSDINNHSMYAHSRLVKQHVAEVPTPPPNVV
jgi:hypothetical protein